MAQAAQRKFLPGYRVPKQFENTVLVSGFFKNDGFINFIQYAANASAKPGFAFVNIPELFCNLKNFLVHISKIKGLPKKASANQFWKKLFTQIHTSILV